jgi:hypothetical protein
MSEMGHDVYFQPSSMGVRKILDEPGDPELESPRPESDVDRLYPGKSRMVRLQEPYVA